MIISPVHVWVARPITIELVAQASRKLPSPQEILDSGEVSQLRNSSVRKFLAVPDRFAAIEMNVSRAFDLCKRPT